jgi:hypothetical protein
MNACLTAWPIFLENPVSQGMNAVISQPLPEQTAQNKLPQRLSLYYFNQDVIAGDTKGRRSTMFGSLSNPIIGFYAKAQLVGAIQSCTAQTIRLRIMPKVRRTFYLIDANGRTTTPSEMIKMV